MCWTVTRCVHCLAAGMLQFTVLCAADAFIPVAEPPQLKQIIVVFKTHFDIGYSAMAKDVVQNYRTTMVDSTLAVIDKNRNLPKDQQFVWTVPGWPMAQMLWSGQDPQRKKKIEQAFRNGNLAVHALPFNTHTETLELEDLVRGMGFSSRLARGYGLELPRAAKMTDVPCHTWVLPTMLKHAGVEFLHVGCGDANQAAAVPSLFWWEGPDGSRLLTMYSQCYGTSLLPPANWPYATWLALLMTYDNMGPPPPEHVKQVLADLARQAPHVKVKIGQLSDFSDAILAEKPDLPVVRGDMPDTWISGPMSAPAGCKIARNIRPMIAAAESVGTLSKVWGLKASDTRDTIAAAYEKSLLYGEHTWGLATQAYVKLVYGKAWDELLAKGLPPNYRHCEESWDEHESYIKDTRSLVEPLLSRELQTLANNVKIDGRRIVVFNPLPWKRNGAVELQTSTNTLAGLKAVDDGQAVPVAVDNKTIRFIAKDVPAMGYRSYYPDEGAMTNVASGSSTFAAAESDSGRKASDVRLQAAEPSSETIESPFFRARLDPVRGAIASLVDRRTGRELVSQTAPQGFGQYLYERFGKKDVDTYIHAFVRPAFYFDCIHYFRCWNLNGGKRLRDFQWYA